MKATRGELLAFLDRHGIDHSTVEHAAAHTVEQARACRGNLPGGHAKNLFLKCKKGNLFLLVAEEETPVRLNQLHKQVGSGRLSFASAQLLEEMLGVTPGAVTPFALMNDKDRQVSLLLDKKLLDHDLLNFHPLENTATTTISRDGLLTFVEKCGHRHRLVDLSTSPQPGSGPPD